MKTHNLKFDISVNGKSVLPEEAAFLYQSDPYPGGLTYRCTISGKYIKKYFSDIPIGLTEDISTQDASSIFLSCGLIWPTSKFIKQKVLLNSIESIDNTGEVIILNGVCSRVIRNISSFNR